MAAAAAPRGTGATPVAGLHGRGTEARALAEALDVLAAERQAIILVEGEAGIVKSRLLREAGLSRPADRTGGRQGGRQGAGAPLTDQPVRCCDAHDAWRRRYTSLPVTSSAWRPAPDDAAPVDDDHLVGGLRGGEPVRDGDGGPPGDQQVQRWTSRTSVAGSTADVASSSTSRSGSAT